MTSHGLKTIKNAMAALNLEYGFVTYGKSPISYPYFVGEYTEVESVNEDGLQETMFMLTGFARGSDGWTKLEQAKAAIAKYFTREGKAFPADDGSISVIAYGYSVPVPKDDAELKSMQINLTVKEWSVN